MSVCAHRTSPHIHRDGWICPGVTTHRELLAQGAGTTCRSWKAALEKKNSQAHAQKPCKRRCRCQQERACQPAPSTDLPERPLAPWGCLLPSRGHPSLSRHKACLNLSGEGCASNAALAFLASPIQTTEASLLSLCICSSRH